MQSRRGMASEPRGVTCWASDASSMRQYKWTGSQQLYRDNPKELWRANPNQPGSVGNPAQPAAGSLPPPGASDMAAWGENIGVAVGYDARKTGMAPPSSG